MDGAYAFERSFDFSIEAFGTDHMITVENGKLFS
jgi:hypothetical protein